MAEQLSDQEQLEAITRWLRKNGPGIAAGIAIGLAAVGGWRWWDGHQRTQAESASRYYDTLLAAVNNDDAPRARGQAAVLTEAYADTTYGALAALMLARLDAEAGKTEAAVGWLEWVLTHTDQRDLRDIARLRLARLLLADGQLDTARAQLDQILSANFAAQQGELRGDIHMARGQIDQARNAYQTALAARGPGSENAALLRWKLDNLPPVQQE
jgi:predicted negative regulator of RcsB-dependent stress response